ITIAAAYSADDAAVILSAQDLLNAACGEAELSRWQITSVEGLTADGWHNTPENLNFYALGFAKDFWGSGQNVVGLVPKLEDTALHLTFTRDDGVVLNRILSVHVQSGSSVLGDTGSDMIDMSQRWEDESSGMLVIQAQGGDDYLRGSAMDDDLIGGAGDDLLTGNWGNDTVYGSEGNDTFQTDWGNDILTGDAGNDTYEIGYLWSGDQDVIDNTTAGVADEDRAVFSHVTDYRELWFAQSGDDLLVTQCGQTGSLTVRDWFATSADNKLEQLVAKEDDGDAYEIAVGTSFDNMLQAMATFAASNGAPMSVTTGVEELHTNAGAWIAVSA
ncbi:MAG: hypothetical protein IT470_00545, partial [Pseudomonadales bacterium]|nr:hypothetical protein [Pseudomonadales bacterium]